MTGYGANAARQHRDALGHPLHEELARARVGRDQLLDLAAQPVVERTLRTVRVALEVEQGLGVDADLPVDDELEAGQPDPPVRQLGERERLVGRPDVHHDLDRDVRHLGQLGPLDGEVEDAVVDEAGVALGARDGDLAAVGQLLGGRAGADHRGDAELAGDDRGVAGAAAAVGDDRRGPLHDRLPVGVGHVGDQHLALAELVHLVDRGRAPGRRRRRSSGRSRGPRRAPRRLGGGRLRHLEPLDARRRATARSRGAPAARRARRRRRPCPTRCPSAGRSAPR